MRFSPENILYIFFCRIGIDKNRGASFFPASGDGPRVLALYSRGNRSGRTSGHGAAQLWRARDEGRDKWRDAATGMKCNLLIINVSKNGAWPRPAGKVTAKGKGVRREAAHSVRC